MSFFSDWLDDLHGLDVAPSKAYATPGMIGCVTLYLFFLTMVAITGLVYFWPSCETPNLASSNVSDLTVTSISPGFGKIEGGEWVSIRGTGFADNTTVSFVAKQGTDADVKIVDSTHLRVHTPSGTLGNVDIVVTNKDGGSAEHSKILVNGFLYIDSKDPLKPSINSITPVSGPFTGGQTVTIKGSGFKNAATVSFGGIPGTNIDASVDTTLVVTTPPHGEGKVDVAVTAGDIGILQEGYTYTCGVILPRHLFMMIILAGALGGCLHGLRSLVWHVGERDLEIGRLLKYFLLPLIGVVIGVIFFLAVSAGFYNVQGGSTQSMILIGLSGLVGMFSDEAVVKLKKIAEGLLTEVPSVGKVTTISVTSITPKYGSSGTEVAILGEAFDEPPIIRFGNKLATVKKSSPTFILVTTPECDKGKDGGKVDLIVINKNGQSFTVPEVFEYKLTEDTPSVTSIVPDSCRPNESIKVTISGTGFDESPSVRFGEKEAAVTDCNQTSIVVTTPELDVGKVDVSVTNKNGQSVTKSKGFECKLTEDTPSVASIVRDSDSPHENNEVTISGAGSDEPPKLDGS